MNEDGTLPWARTKGLWDRLYERGVVRRSFNAKRFTWIRRMLSGMGLVEVQDPTYVIGKRAAKWSPSAGFWSLASSLDHKEGEEGQDFTETTLRQSSLRNVGKRASRSYRRRSGKGIGGKGGAWTNWSRRSSVPATGIWRLEAQEGGEILCRDGDTILPCIGR